MGTPPFLKIASKLIPHRLSEILQDKGIASFYPNMSVAPDWLLGSLFGLVGIAGMYLGARFQKFVPAKVIKWMLSAIIIFTAYKYISGFFH